MSLNLIDITTSSLDYPREEEAPVAERALEAMSTNFCPFRPSEADRRQEQAYMPVEISFLLTTCTPPHDQEGCNKQFRQNSTLCANSFRPIQISLNQRQMLPVDLRQNRHLKAAF